MSSKKRVKRAGRPGREPASARSRPTGERSASEAATKERRRRVQVRVGLVLLGFVVATGLAYAALFIALDPRVPPTGQHVVAAIDAGAAYLVRHLDDDGRFEYVVDVDGNPASRGRYNVLRHAGSLYGLGMARAVDDDPATREAILRGAGYLLRRHVAKVRGLDATQAVFSLPGEEVRRRVAKLGGSALGVLGLAAARDVEPDAVALGTLQELGRFLRFMQEDDGHFVSKYAEGRGYLRDFESVYYPGEAALALATLYEIDGDPSWLDTALDAVAYLERTRRGTPVHRLPNDHWLLIAIGALADRFDAVQGPPPIDRGAVLAHGKDIARSMLLEQGATGWVPGVRGAFDPNGRITPASTRLEGLVALHGALEPGDPFRARLRKAIRRGVGFVLAGQLEAPPAAAGGFVEALPGPFSKMDREETRSIRIDYVQHALSALVGWQRILTGNEGRRGDPTD